MNPEFPTSPMQILPMILPVSFMYLKPWRFKSNISASQILLDAFKTLPLFLQKNKIVSIKRKVFSLWLQLYYKTVIKTILDVTEIKEVMRRYLWCTKNVQGGCLMMWSGFLRLLMQWLLMQVCFHAYANRPGTLQEISSPAACEGRVGMQGCLKPEETFLMESNKISCLSPLHGSVKKANKSLRVS